MQPPNRTTKRSLRSMSSCVVGSNSRQHRRTTMRMHSWNTLLVVLLLLSPSCVSAAPKRRKDGNAHSRNVSIFNKAAAKIDIFWIHPTTGALADSNTSGEGIVFGAMTGVNSYVGHKFEIQELPNPTTGKCKHSECRKGYFSCSEQENQVINIDTDEHDNFIVSVDDDRSKAEREAKRVLETCQADASTASTPSDQLTALAACLEQQADAKMAATMDEIEFQKDLRKQLGAKLQDYTCDHSWNTINVTTTHSLLNATYPPHQKQVELLFESDFSSVRLYREFLTAHECQAIMVGQSAAASDAALQKIRDLVSSTIGDDPYVKGTKSIRVRVDGTAEGECALTDGACDESTDTSRALMRVTQTDDTIYARLLVTCTSETVQGGVTFYPKAGVRIVPVSGEAVLTVYKNLRGKSEEDPFVDDHVTCPVQKGVVLTLEDTF